MVANKLPLGKQDFIYFIGYNDDKRIRHLCIVSAYVTDFDETECIYFMIKQEKLSDRYMEIWEKVSSITKKFNIELIIVKNI